MMMQDWQVRGRIERLLAKLSASGQAVSLTPAFVDTGLDPTAAWGVGLANMVTKVVNPSKDCPFLWVGNTMPRVLTPQTSNLRPTHEKLIRVTLLSPGWQLGNAVSAQGFTGFIPLQVMMGYEGKPSLWPYPYLFSAFEQVQFDYFTDSSGQFHQHLMFGYKLTPVS